MRRGGRLVLMLGVLIAAAAALFLVFVMGQPQQPQNEVNLPPTQEPMRRIIVARIDIPNGTVLTDTETYLQEVEIPESEFNAQASEYVTLISDVQGKLTVREIVAASPVFQSDVIEGGLSLRIPAGGPDEPNPKAYPLQVNNQTGVADQIRQGDQVDVLATFSFTRVFLRPSFNEEGELIIKEEVVADMLSTKTLLQNVEVLKIVKPPVVEGTPEPGQDPSNPPETDASGQPIDGSRAAGQPNDALTPGSWFLVLAVTDQEAEIIDFARRHGNIITLVLRGRGDTAVETTLGATIDLLVSQFGLPLPQPAEPVISGPEDLTPLPTVATTPEPEATPTPTP